MSEILATQCTRCGLTWSAELLSSMYVQDSDGAWIRCEHPGEMTTAMTVLGVSARELMDVLRPPEDGNDEGPGRQPSQSKAPGSDDLARRVRFTQGLYCRSCSSLFESGVEASCTCCPTCGSTDSAPLAATMDETLVGGVRTLCPRCGSDSVVTQPTGLHL